MLFVPPSIPFMVPEAEALTEAECLALAGYEFGPQYNYRYYTVLTCEIPFDVTVYPGQRLQVTIPGLINANSFPWMHVQGHGEAGAIGTYQYETGTVSGIVRIVNTPSISVSVQNVTSTFSGSQMTVSGNIVNSNSYAVKNPYVMWSVTDDAGNEKGTWQRYGGTEAYTTTIPAGGTHTFSETLCCGDSGMTTATPYIVQAFREDGTPLVNVPIYPGEDIEDSTPPVITMPDNITLSTSNSTGNTATFSVSVSDNAGIIVGWSCSVADGWEVTHPSSSNTSELHNVHFAIGDTIVTCTATDQAGNEGTGTFTVTVILDDTDTIPPTSNFFVNSPLGTVSIQPVAGGGFERLAYIATDSSGYYLKLYVDVSDDTSGAWLNQNASTCQVSGLTQEQETDSFNNGELIDKNIRDEDGQIIAGNNPMLLSSGPLNGNSGSGDYHYYQFPINGFEQGNIDYNDYYLIYCKATDPAGNEATYGFVLTILPESGQTEKPCWSDYCDNIVPDITPPVVTFPNLVTQNIIATNSTGYNFSYLAWGVCVGGGNDSCDSYWPMHHDTNGSNHMSCSPTSDSLFPVGTTTVTCTATDAAGNVGTASFPITVTLEGATDTTPPVITIPELTTVQWEYGEIGAIELTMSGSIAPTATWSVSATDNVGVTHGPACWNDDVVDAIYGQNGPTKEEFVNVDTPSGTAFPMGTSYMKCVALDAAGNVGIIYWHVIVTEATEEEEIVIPSWIKNNAGWWASNQIDDRAFVSGLQWLITNGVMHIPPTEQGAGSDDVIPGWIKNNANWWADDLIDDRNFVTGLQWLITNGIMIIG